MRDVDWSQWIAAGQTIVDVGANVGEYTIEFARAVGSKGRVIAFEPDARTASICEDHCEAYPWVEVRTQAVGCVSGRSVFYRTHEPMQGSRYTAACLAPVVATLDVEAVSLDDVIDGEIHGLKIDAQGDDGWVLEGARQTLTKMPDGAWVVCEIWPEGLRLAGYDMPRLVDVLQGWTLVAEGKSYGLTRKSLSDVVTKAQHFREGRHTNVFLRKG